MSTCTASTSRLRSHQKKRGAPPELLLAFLPPHLPGLPLPLGRPGLLFFGLDSIEGLKEIPHHVGPVGGQLPLRVATSRRAWIEIFSEPAITGPSATMSCLQTGSSVFHSTLPCGIGIHRQAVRWYSKESGIQGGPFAIRNVLLPKNLTPCNDFGRS